jgi:hypothetical protein
MGAPRETVPASTRNLPVIIGITAAVGVVVGVLYANTGAGGVLLFAGLYFVGIVLWIVPGQRQVTITETLVEVRRTAGAKPEAQAAHAGLRLEKRGGLFSWWSIGDRRYSTPTARAEPLFALVEQQS